MRNIIAQTNILRNNIERLRVDFDFQELENILHNQGNIV